MLKREIKCIIIKNTAQSILEYSMILGIIGVVLYTMGPLFQRSIQGMIKITADQIGNQENADQTFDDHGHMDLQQVKAFTDTKKGYREKDGTISYEYDDTSKTDMQILINMGYQEGTE